MTTPLESFRYHADSNSKELLLQVLDGKVVVCCDTNVLLRFYEIAPDRRRRRFKVLEALGDSLFIPFQVKLEFFGRRDQAMGKVSAEYQELRAAAAALTAAAGAFGGSAKGAGKRTDNSVTSVRDAVTEAVKKLLLDLDRLEKKDPHIVSIREDVVLEALENILNGKVGRRPPADLIASQVSEFERVRVPLRIPPGFEDAGKGDIVRASGDYLIWAEMLREARRRDADLVFVTDDEKSDWWVQGGNGRRTGPHPLLIAEFEDLAEPTSQTSDSSELPRYVQLTGKNFFDNTKLLSRLGIEAAARGEHDDVDEQGDSGAEGDPFGGGLTISEEASQLFADSPTNDPPL